MSADGRLPAALVSRRSLLCRLPAAALLPALAGLAQAAPAAAGPRVVSLDYGLASTLLALGVVPLGISDLAGWDRWVVEPRMPEGVVDLGASAEVNLEVLAGLKPDFILATPYLDAQLPLLRQFGTVLRLETFRFAGTPILAAAIAATRTLAAALGRAAEAERVVAEMDAFFDACRRRLAAAAPPPVAFLNFMDARHARIYGDPGLYNDVLARIGVRNAWTERSNDWGFQMIAIEELSRIADRDAVLVAFDPVPADVLPTLARSPLWRSLPVARPGRFFVLPPSLMFGMVNEAVRFAGLVTDLLEREA